VAARPDLQDSRRSGREEALASKLHPALAQLVACVKGAADRKALAACGVGADGRISVNVWLNVDSTPALVERIVRAGLVLSPSQRAAGPRTIAGRVTPAALSALIAMAEVRLVGLAQRG
jgi:hypothetical protein